MSIFALIKNNIVKNIAEADSREILEALVPEVDIIVEVTEESGYAYIDGEYRNNKFIPIPAYSSWIFDENIWAWKPPVDKPEDDNLYSWDEAGLKWIIFEEPLPLAE